MKGPHEIECRTGLSCPDQYCRGGEIILSVIDWARWYDFIRQAILYYPLETRFHCDKCCDVWVDRDCIDYHR